MLEKYLFHIWAINHYLRHILIKMDKYPLTKDFISKAYLKTDHFLKYVDDGNLNLSAFELFFSMKNLPGFLDKENEIKSRPIHKPFSIEGMKSWESTCAELSAIELVFQEYGVQINGFNQHSPKSLKAKNDCDFTGIWHNETLYFEVKNNCAEESQDIPQGLLNELRKTDWGYTLGIETKKHNLKITNPNEIVQDLRKHLTDQKKWRQENVPSDVELQPGNYHYHNNELLIRFLPRNDFSREVRYYIRPSLHDICSYLFGIGNSDNNKTPMVEEAKLKGADYLVCRLPRFEAFHEIINKSFKIFVKKEESVYLVSDGLLNGIVGIILFNKKRKHCSILNSNSNPKFYLTN